MNYDLQYSSKFLLLYEHYILRFGLLYPLEKLERIEYQNLIRRIQYCTPMVNAFEIGRLETHF